MRFSNLIADIKYGWRLWRFERLRWWFLAISFGLFCGLTVVVVQLATRLSQDRPSWVGTEASLYTLSYAMQGQMITSKGSHLDLASSLPGVQGFSKFVLMKRQVRLNGHLTQASILFYDEAFFTVLGGVSALPSSLQHNGIFSSAAFAAKLANNDQRLQLSQSEVPIQPLKSKAFDRFAGKTVDLYLPASYLAYWFGMGRSNSTDLQSLLNALPLYHAVLVVKPSFNAVASQRQLQQWVDEAADDSVSVNIAPQVNLVHGVELYPQQRTEIMRQLWLIGLMLGALMVILGSNYAAVMANQAVLRSQEFSVQFAVGARLVQQIKQVLAENLLFFCSIIVFAQGFAYLANAQLYRSELFQLYFGSGFTFSWIHWGLTLISCVSLIMLATLLPTVSVLKKQHFQRTVTGISRTQRILLQAQFTAQAMLTMLALSLCFAVTMQEWQKQRVTDMAQRIFGYQLERQDIQSFVLPEQQVRGINSAIAISNEPLIKRHAPFNAVQLADGNGLKPIFTDMLFVSDNFFRSLNITLLVTAPLGPQEVIVNSTLAQRLLGSREQDIKQLIGKTLKLDDEHENGYFKIVGIAADIPHAGVRFKNLPMVYRSLQDRRILDGPIYLYSQAELTSADLNAITSTHGDALRLVPLENLSKQLLALDGAGSGLFVLTLQINLLIVLLTAVGMLNQMKVQLSNDRQLFALQFALGQRSSQLMGQLSYHYLLLVFFATLGCFVLLKLLQPKFDTLGLEIMHYLPIGLAILLTIISLISVILIVIWTFSKQSLRQLLTH